MVRGYVVTDLEQQIMEKFLADGEKDAGFYVLVKRLRTVDVKSLKSQVDLVSRFVKKLEAENFGYKKA